MGETREEAILRNLKTWYRSVDFNEFVGAIEERVIGQKTVRYVCANVFNYIGNLIENRPTHNNMILTAPSGCGKTETYRALYEYFEKHVPMFPIYIVDVSQLTASGYKGLQPEDLLTPFFEMHMESAMGICFLDEFDKKLVPLHNSDDTDINREAQSNMLTLIEGSEVIGKRGETVNTAKVMFVGLGSFDAFRSKREAVTKHIGFGAENENPNIAHYEPITAENMIEHGGTKELIGRFPFIFAYDALTYEAVSRIIDKVTAAVSDSFDCDIRLEDEMIAILHDQANNKFGCRMFDSMIRSIVIKLYADALGEKTSDKLFITIQNAEYGTFTWREYTDYEIAI